MSVAEFVQERCSVVADTEHDVVERDEEHSVTERMLAGGATVSTKKEIVVGVDVPTASVV